MSKQRIARISSFLVGSVLLTVPAGASHWRGIRATVQSVDQGSRVVDISVTGYTYETGGEPGPFTETFVEENSPTTGLGRANDSLAIPAIAWGDGETLSETALPGVAGGTPPFFAYRAAFSHTYEAPGSYTIRVASVCCAPSPESPSYEEILTGNYAEGQLTNTAQVVLGTAISEVPISRGGLFALATLLGGAAVWLVRRG